VANKRSKTIKLIYSFLLIALFCSASLAVDGNLTSDTKVNFEDLSIIAQNWLGSCSGSSWCNGADINTDSIVNMKDFALLAENWDTDSSLVGWWKMQGPIPGESARLVKDYSGYGNDGTMGSSDTWLEDGGIDFQGGSWGASGIIFPNSGADLAADMGLTNQVTISYVATWDGLTATTNYPYDGRDSSNLRILSSECPTGNHIRDHKGGADIWCWEAFGESDARFIFGKVDKTWGDFIRISTTVDFTTGNYKVYVDELLYYSATGKIGSFNDLATFTIGRTLWAEMDGSMKDFRIYNRALEPQEIVQLCIETPETAWNQSPANGDIAATTPDFDLTLSWSAGKSAQSHDIYFGTSFSAVENATHTSPEYKGNLTKYTTSYDLTSLDPNLTYYWRVDEICTERIYAGQTLSFTVSDVWLYTFHNSVGDLDADERICAYTIQGFANKTKARLYIDTINGKAGNPEADAYWIDYLETNKGYKFGIVNNLRDLVQLAKASGFVDGLVLYDPYALADSGEVMPALNIASEQNRLPVTANMLAYTSKELQNFGTTKCFDGMNTIDIRNTWATHLAAQTDYVNNHMPGKPKTGVCKVHQNFATFNDQHNFNGGLDYGIIKGYFIFDMAPMVSAQRPLYDAVMDYLDKPAMVYGGWHDEMGDLAASSAKGNYTVLSTSNLSFMAHVEADPANLYMRKPTTGKVLDENKYYVMIQASDGDSMGYEASLKPSGWYGHSVWLDPDRGTTPITWTTQPLAAELWPAITEYYVLTSTSNDTFCTGPSGAGYCRPSELPNLADFSAFTEIYLQLTGIQWIENWWGKSEDMWNTMKAYAPSIKCFGHQGTSGGLNHWLDDGTPVAISQGDSLWHPKINPTNPADPYNISDPNNIVNHITAFAATKQPPYFITCYDTPPYALLYSKQCQASLPANFEMVTVEDFIDLMDQMVHPKPWGTLLTYDDFESGFGNYTDGGSNCGYYTGSDLSRLGTHAVYVQDIASDAASIYHTNGIDVHTPGYAQIKITFWFITKDVNNGERLLVQYFDGSEYQTIETYTIGNEVENDKFYRKTIYIDETTHNFPTNMKLKFMSDASNNYDLFYIDCITVEAK